VLALLITTPPKQAGQPKELPSMRTTAMAATLALWTGFAMAGTSAERQD